jgi:hypothetical protein
VTLQKYFLHPSLVIYFFFQPNQQQVLLHGAVPFTNLSILWEKKCWAKIILGSQTKTHHVLIFLHPIFPCRAGGAALRTLFSISEKDDTLWLLLHYFYLRKGLVWPVQLAQVLPRPQLIFPSKT